MPTTYKATIQRGRQNGETKKQASQEKSSERELNEMEVSNPPDTELKKNGYKDAEGD